MEQTQEKESFETTLRRLEEIVVELERGELPLEHAIARYEEGVHRLNRCYAILDSLEKKVALLSKKEDGSVHEVPFLPETKNLKR